MERTGRSMREWMRMLDRWGAKGKGHVQWITEAKRPETRARRIAETVKKLSAR